jgi:hypothetical protein
MPGRDEEDDPNKAIIQAHRGGIAKAIDILSEAGERTAVNLLKSYLSAVDEWTA